MHLNAKFKLASMAAGIAIALGGAATANAAPVETYGDLLTPGGWYAGNGPANGNFTIVSDTDALTGSAITIGLRAKDRGTVTSIDGSSGIYHAQAGPCTPAAPFCGGAPKSDWNYEFSINSSLGLLGYTIVVRVDNDPTLGGTNFLPFGTLNVYTNWSDNEFNDQTGAAKRVSSSAPIVGLLDDLPLPGESTVQQSVNSLFGNAGFGPTGLDLNAQGYFTIAVDVFNPLGTLVATNDIIVQVPEPASLALLGLGLAGIGFSRRKKQA